MKISKPETMALLYRHCNLKGTNTLSVGMTAMFSLNRPDILYSEREYWDYFSDQEDTPDLFDTGWPKPAGEYFVYGTAHAPGLRPVNEMTVNVQIGTQTKTVVVSGDRLIDPEGRRLYSWETFVQMPLTPHQAYGGSGVLHNTLGKGWDTFIDEHGSLFRRLPNVEFLEHEMTGTDGEVTPAGYWRWPPTHPDRLNLLGTPDNAWLSAAWPGLPADASTEFFHEAPPDQRVKNGFWRGDESISLSGFSADKVIYSRFPGLRARCFTWTRKKSAEGTISLHLKSHEARAETLWIFPDSGMGVVLYRACFPVSEAAASESFNLYAAWEYLEHEPLSEEFYLTQIAETDTPPVGEEKDSLNGNPGSHIQSPQRQSYEHADNENREELNKLSLYISELEKIIDQTLKKDTLSNGTLEESIFSIPPLPPLRPLSDIAREIEEIKEKNESLLKKKGVKPFDTERHFAELQGDTARKVLENAGQGLEAHIEYLKGFIAKEHGNTTGTDTGTLSILDASITRLKKDISDFLDENFAEIEKYDKFSAEEVISTKDNKSSVITREEVISRYRKSKSLAGADLTGIDLSDIELCEADFKGAILECTSFAGSKLSGACFDSCIILDTDFSSSCLEEASFISCRATGAIFRHARMLGCQIIQSDFGQANLSGADLRESCLSESIFDAAVLSDALLAFCRGENISFYQAILSGSDFMGCTLSKPDFRAADLNETNFCRASLSDADFSLANVVSTNFESSNLNRSRATEGTNFSHSIFKCASLISVSWSGASCINANFAQSIMTDADLSYCELSYADFYHCEAGGCRLSYANLTGADLTIVNLMNGSLRNATINSALFYGANLYLVDCEGIRAEMEYFKGAIISKTLLEHRKLPDKRDSAYEAAHDQR
ncbi:hypothetical protein CWM66_21235 [Kosakonia sp. H7A]|uniref:DUF2169 family type VI secretion system accessory protein n=1 Tax=Kosakonia sp. H7A TaxID=2054598 RepID=UPI000D16172E|nr:DUF2169 domain-containing protein [Kosakonia sp. H7A]PTA88980.1 hypothetical protein CWM66_21235 [Kosakonia sp. H7A]